MQRHAKAGGGLRQQLATQAGGGAVRAHLPTPPGVRRRRRLRDGRSPLQRGDTLRGGSSPRSRHPGAKRAHRALPRERVQQARHLFGGRQLPCARVLRASGRFLRALRTSVPGRGRFGLHGSRPNQRDLCHRERRADERRLLPNRPRPDGAGGGRREPLRAQLQT